MTEMPFYIFVIRVGDIHLLCYIHLVLIVDIRACQQVQGQDSEFGRYPSYLLRRASELLFYRMHQSFLQFLILLLIAEVIKQDKYSESIQIGCDDHTIFLLYTKILFQYCVWQMIFAPEILQNNKEVQSFYLRVFIQL